MTRMRARSGEQEMLTAAIIINTASSSSAWEQEGGGVQKGVGVHSMPQGRRTHYGSHAHGEARRAGRSGVVPGAVPERRRHGKATARCKRAARAVGAGGPRTYLVRHNQAAAQDLWGRESSGGMTTGRITCRPCECIEHTGGQEVRHVCNHAYTHAHTQHTHIPSITSTATSASVSSISMLSHQMKRGLGRGR